MSTRTGDPVTNITFKADELRRLLANASLFACKDDTLPSICVVHFTWDHNQLFAVATNRYIFAWEESFPVQSKGRGSFSVSVKGDVKRILAMLPKKTEYRPEHEVTVEYDAEARQATFTFEGNAVKVSTECGEFPRNWRRFSEGFIYGPRDGISFNATFLALFAKVETEESDPNNTVRLAFQEGNKPSLVSKGEHFSAVLIPVRAAGS